MNEILNIGVLTSLYFWVGVITTALFVIKLLIFSMFGMDDGSGDLMGTDVDTEFNFISLQSIIAFLMGFGWLGYAAIQWGFGGKISVLFAIVGGVILMALSAYLMFIMKKLNFTPKYDLKTCVDKTGTSYTRFDAKGMGKIQIEFNGKLQTFDAWNDTDSDIESFKQIKVTRVEDDKIFIKEIG